MEYLIKVSALIVLLYLGYTIFLKKETFFNHNRWFLLLGLVAALILPLIVIPIYISVEPISNSEIPTNFIIDNSADIAQKTPFDWSQILSLIYGIGVIICLTQFILQFGSLLILLLKNAKNKDGIYTYVIVKNRISPFSFFKWIVYNPNLFSNEELQLIINHEKVHVRQWHSLDIVLSRLACVFFWFNPLMWFYHKDIQQNLEYIADKNAQNSSDSEKNYQHLLLKTSVGNNNSNLTSNFYNSLIKKRIVMLQKSRSKSVNRWKSIFILPFFAIFLMSFNTEEVFIEVEKTKSTIKQNKVNSGFGNSKIVSDSIISERFEIIFTNKTNEKSFTQFETELEKKGIKMNIKTLKRNNQGIITKITIDFTSEHGSTKYSVMDNDGISNFYFRLDDGHKMSVGAFKSEIIEVEEQEIIEVIEEPQVIEEIIEVIEEEEEGNKRKTKTFVIRQNGNTTKISGDTIHIIESNPKIKGKYIFRTKDSIVVGKPNTAYTFKSNGNAKVSSNSFTVKTDSINYKNTIRFRNSKGKNPIYIVNGKVASKKDLKKMNPNKIAEVTVIKGDKATTVYGKNAKDGVIEIKTKGKASKKKNPWQISKIEATDVFKTSTKEELKKFLSTANKPLIAINGDILGNIDVKNLDYSIIKSISIVDDKTATEIYGNQGKNGIVVITTNEAKNRFERLTQNNEDYNVQVGSIRFVDDNKDNKMVLHFITKNTPDNLMETHKKDLAANGITVKYSKLKRNKDGEIIRLKVSVKDEDGNSSVGSFNNANGIPTINFGKYGDDLVVSSKPL